MHTNPGLNPCGAGPRAAYDRSSLMSSIQSGSAIPCQYKWWRFRSAFKRRTSSRFVHRCPGRSLRISSPCLNI
ncbi:hypothetical protein QJS10_CPA05g00803 [Acorus calamus]|uniref:Uncharacterized protein n=1 Tax=Acorus calamus TaxID=4465 RepID=A0AAV9EUY3_ACOCL|nr:hypothetical protein QJS10_CPA05g00803 [Acorus calamus]